MKLFTPLFALLVSSSSILHAQSDDPMIAKKDDPYNGGYLTFYLDNDLFAGQDSNYTNGARLSWISCVLTKDQIAPIHKPIQAIASSMERNPLLRGLIGFDGSDKVRYQVGFALTQLMYTPNDFSTSTPPPGERNYAGWLGLGMSFHAKDENTLNSLELTFGIIGPHAYAEQAQDFIHSVKQQDKFNGWDSQVPDEFTFNLHFTQTRRLRFLESGLRNQFSAEGNAEWGFSAGNFRTDAKLGLLFRFGWNIPADFSDPRLSATANSQRLYINSAGDDTRQWSLYFLAGARVNAVLHDASLDGPVFRNFDTGLSKQAFVGEVYAGFGMSWRSWELSYVHTFRSEEYESQSEGSEFGSIAIRYRF